MIRNILTSIACCLFLSVGLQAQNITVVDVLGRQTNITLESGLKLDSYDGFTNIIDESTGAAIYETSMPTTRIIFNSGNAFNVGFKLNAVGVEVTGNAKCALTVYDANGRQITNAVSSDGYSLIRSKLPKGTVIVKAGGQTLKIYNR